MRRVQHCQVLRLCYFSTNGLKISSLQHPEFDKTLLWTSILHQRAACRGRASYSSGTTHKSINSHRRFGPRKEAPFDRLSVLEVQRFRLVQERQQIRAAVSPLRRFPPELIARVLELCLPEELDQECHMFFATLGSVCKIWRQVAFSTPSLWSGLLLENVENADGAICTQLRRWFDRAGASPLSFSLSPPYSKTKNAWIASPSGSEALRKILLVTTDDHNWESLDFCLFHRGMEEVMDTLLHAVEAVAYRPWRNLKSLGLPAIEVLLAPSPTNLWRLGGKALVRSCPSLQSFRTVASRQLPDSVFSSLPSIRSL